MTRPGLLIPVLAIAALFFGWRTYEAWTGPAGATGPPPAGPAPVPIGVAPEETIPAMDLSAPMASIMARPLFRPDRKPYREEAVQVPRRNYEAELTRLTLLGVLLLGKDKRGVVVGRSGTGREERWEVGPGDTLPGFIVKDVGAEGLTLIADDRELLLPLYAGAPKGPTGQAPVRTVGGSSPGPPTTPAQKPARGAP